MSKVYSVKMPDDVAALFDAALRAAGTTANRKLQTLVYDWVNSRNTPSLPGIPPPLPIGATVPASPVLDGRGLVAVMRRLATKAKRTPGRLTEEDHHALAVELAPYEKHFESTTIPSYAEAALYNLTKTGQCWNANGSIDMVHEDDWGCIFAVEEDLDVMAAFGQGK